MTRAAHDKCGICAIIARLAQGKSPDLIAELPNSWVVLGDAQFYRGYCVLLAKRHVPEPFLMPRAEALNLFGEVCSVAEAIAEVTHPLKLNYECLGNVEPHVHWHIFPRHDDDEQKRSPVWERPAKERMRTLDEHDRGALMAALRAEVSKRIPNAHLPGD